MTYRPPLKEMTFVMNEVLGLSEILALEPFSHIDTDDVAGLLAEAGRFTAEIIAPLNRIGDEQPSTIDPDGAVTAPPGFKDAYRQYREAGWTGIQFSAEYGGGGLPWIVGLANQEFATSANMAFSLCPLLSQGAIEALTAHGSDEQKAVYLEKMITGEWSGTMNLTEPNAGSDVGALSTKAIPRADGSYSIVGTKIFITWGEHDLTDNIIHLVLARVPDAPPGTRGISLFIVPKFFVNPDGSLGDRNDVRCVSLEHKLGIRASPTAVMAYGENEGAVGFLVGEENQGMRYMFTMMNNARLTVGLEGLALSERAYQQAVAYAQERVQGSEPGSSEPVVIGEHPDVRRMLMTMKSNIDAMRSLLYLNAKMVDIANVGTTPDERREAHELAALLTPLSKAWCTDLGVEMTSLAVQVFGGMGYIEETGVAQHWRDARIAPIYEGTNGIQAIDLVMRKLPLGDGAVVGRLFADIEKTLSAMTGPRLDGLAGPLERALDATREATAYVTGAAPVDRLAAATPYLRMLATLVGGWLMAKAAVAADNQLDANPADRGFLTTKIASATFFITQTLPGAMGLSASVTAGADQLMAVGLDGY